MIRVFTALAIVALAGLSAEADCRRVVRVQHVQAVQAVAIQPVYAATYVPIAVTVPVYSIGYQAPVDVGQLLAEFRALRQEVQALKVGPVPATAPAPVEVPKGDGGAKLNHLSVFVAKCAGCHDRSQAEKKGDGFVLLDGGQLAPLTHRQALRVAAVTFDGTMPKGGKGLTDEEVGAVMSWIATIK